MKQKEVYNMENDRIREPAIKEYQRWIKAALEIGDRQLFKELKALSSDEGELVDAFCADLHFGTSGLRGVLGPGTNRMNEYVVKRTTQGLANYLKRYTDAPSVVIAYDTRVKSKIFAKETAGVLQANGIQVYLFSELATVSLLSYAIRALNCTMGIMITASHNPKIFNGYKVYNSQGYQIVGSMPEDIFSEIRKVDFFDRIPFSYEGIEAVPSEVGQNFTNHILDLCPDKSDKADCALVYTPLNGTGNAYVRKILAGCGFQKVFSVPSQEAPDENFPTCSTPNPEKISVYNEGFKVLERYGGDAVIATDPDCDRVGVCLLHDGMKVLLTGNQLAILMLDYLCRVRPPRKGQFIVKSIVSTPLADDIARRNGLGVVNTLTGFKYIGQIITDLAREGRDEQFYFGFEESNGYLMSPFLRDKDGVSSAMLAACLTSYYKKKGMDLIDGLRQIYRKYGTCIDKTRNYFFEGPYGSAAMNQVMEYFRTQVIDTLGSAELAAKTDFLKETGLPKSNVIGFQLKNGTQCMIRPSGTESKIKVYYYETEPEEKLEAFIKDRIESFKNV